MSFQRNSTACSDLLHPWGTIYSTYFVVVLCTTMTSCLSLREKNCAVVDYLADLTRLAGHIKPRIKQTSAL